MFDIKDKLNVKVVTVYKCYESIDEVSDEDATGRDYSGLEVFINNVIFLRFGDHYHEKGIEKADAVVETLEALFGDERVIVNYEERIDRQ